MTEKKIKNNTFYDKGMVVFIIKSILRYKFWCMLETEQMRVRFDYDYYMTIGCVKYCTTAIEKIQKIGLFVEIDDLDCLFEEKEESSHEEVWDNSNLSALDIN